MNIGNQIRMRTDYTLSDFDFKSKFIFKEVRVPEWDYRRKMYEDRRTFTVIDTQYRDLLIRDNLTLLEYSVDEFGFIIV